MLCLSRARILEIPFKAASALARDADLGRGAAGVRALAAAGVRARPRATHRHARPLTSPRVYHGASVVVGKKGEKRTM